MQRAPGPDRAEINRNLIIVAWTAPAAILVYFILHAVYENLMVTAAAVGEIDTSTHIGLDMGYMTMVGGTAVFAAIALVAAVKALRAWLSGRSRP